MCINAGIRTHHPRNLVRNKHPVVVPLDYIDGVLTPRDKRPIDGNHNNNDLTPRDRNHLLIHDDLSEHTRVLLDLTTPGTDI